MNRVELGVVRDRLIDNHVSESLAEDLILRRNAPVVSDRRLLSFKNRWVDIVGNQYQVVDVSPSETCTGIEDLVVRLHNGSERAVTPEWADKVVLLPGFWKRPTYQFVSHTPEPESLRHVRGPPPRSPVLPEFAWKYELVYDPIESVWTDREVAKGHGLIDQAGKLWEQSDRLAIIAEAKWHVHRGDERLVAWMKESDREALVGAYTEYDRAIQLVPNYADAYLRRGCVRMEAGMDEPALDDLETAIEHDAKERYIVLPSLEMQSRIYSRMPIKGETVITVWRNHTAALKEANTAFEQALTQARQRFVDITIDPATQPRNRRDEELRTSRTSAVAAAGMKLKVECEQASGKRQSAVANASASLRSQMASITWMHDNAIEKAEQAISQAASGQLRTITEMLPPTYRESPVEEVLKRIDPEETDSRYSRLLAFVRSNAAKKTAEAAESTSATAETITDNAEVSVPNTVTWSESALRDAIKTTHTAIEQISDARILLADVAVALATRANEYDRTALDSSFNTAASEWQAKAMTWMDSETHMRQTMGKHERNLASFYLAAMHASADCSAAHDRFGAALSYSARGAINQRVPLPARKVPTKHQVRPDFNVLDFNEDLGTAQESLLKGDFEDAISRANDALRNAGRNDQRAEAMNLLSNAITESILTITHTPQAPGFE
ncbi:MAG: hypothetical protein H6822_20280 [Planctomycetaceae bacterium]|nr:hypothetical protein [Planctomycetaceae bacterium]